MKLYLETFDNMTLVDDNFTYADENELCEKIFKYAKDLLNFDVHYIRILQFPEPQIDFGSYSEYFRIRKE